jgi:pimeloyl-ACP methyl ester carboxylesterase
MVKISKILILVLLFAASLLVLLSYSYRKDLTIPDNLSGKYIEINGTKLRVFQKGAGPNVLFLHGSIGSLEDFETVIPLLDNYRVTTFDRIGHGFSELPPHPATIASNAQYTSDLINKLQLTNVILVGHSYGGSIALKMAIKRDPNIKALLLLAPATKPAETRAIEDLLAKPVIGMGLLRILQPFIAEDLLREGLMESLKPNQDRVPDNFIQQRIQLWNDPGILFTRIQQTKAVNQELAEMQTHYPGIQLPTIILLGEQESHEDIYIGSQELVEAMPNANLHLVEGAGHYLQYKDPKTVAQSIAKLGAFSLKQ